MPAPGSFNATKLAKHLSISVDRSCSILCKGSLWPFFALRTALRHLLSASNHEILSFPKGHRHMCTATWFTLCYGWRVGIVHTNVDVTASAVNAPAESASQPTSDLTLPYLTLPYLNLTLPYPTLTCPTLPYLTLNYVNIIILLFITLD